MLRGRRRSLWIAPLLLSFLTVGLPVATTIPNLTSGPALRGSLLPHSSVGGLSANTTWNGADVRTAGTASSAITSSLGSTIRLHYTWTASSPPGSVPGPTFNLSTARLEMFYFGYSLATRDVVAENPRAATNGSFDMTWDPGYLQWLLAGMYELKASLLAPNGTEMWEEQFFVRVTVPGGLGAVLPILLVVVAGAEVYDLATSGRQAGLKPRAPEPPTESDGTEKPVESTDSSGSLGEESASTTETH